MLLERLPFLSVLEEIIIIIILKTKVGSLLMFLQSVKEFVIWNDEYFYKCANYTGDIPTTHLFLFLYLYTQTHKV